jgi:hypothetical protein
LTDYESTIKDSQGQYIDFCKRCLSFVGDIQCTGNPLVPDEEYFEEGIDRDSESGYNSYYAGDEVKD